MSVNFLWYFFKVWVKVYSSKGFPFAFIRHSTIPPPQYYYKPNSHLFFVLWNHTSAYQFKLQNSIPGLCFECSGMDFGNFFFPSHPNLKWKVSSPSPFAGWIFSHLVFSEQYSYHLLGALDVLSHTRCENGKSRELAHNSLGDFPSITSAFRERTYFFRFCSCFPFWY